MSIRQRRRHRDDGTLGKDLRSSDLLKGGGGLLVSGCFQPVVLLQQAPPWPAENQSTYHRIG